MRKSWIFATLILLLGSCSEPAQVQVDSAGQVTVYRDQYGTPHVVADSNRGVYFGFGYAVASDRLFQMEMLKRTAEGRVAAVLGADYLALDTQLRTAYDHRSIGRQLQHIPAFQREVLQAYADGFNRRIEEVLADRSKLLPAEFSDYNFEPEPWSAYDVAMIFVGSVAHRYSDFNSERDNLHFLQQLEQRHGKDKAWRIFSAGKWLLDSDSPTTVPRAVPAPDIATNLRPAYLDELPQTGAGRRVALATDGRFLGLTDTPALALQQRRQLAAWGFSSSPEFTGASNFWAARQLSDAQAALVNGPQFGFGVPSYVYGIGLHGGDFNAVGNTLLGLPSLLFAHNNHIAWGSTAGISDQSDEFALVLHPENQEQYRHGDRWRTFASWPETIQVAGAAPVTVTARRSVHGMVLDYQPGAHRAWVRSRAWEGQELTSLMAWIFLATDTSLDGAQQRIGAMATNINMYTMDKFGNLAYTHSGRYPLRASGHDPRLPAPGHGAWDWQALRPSSDNPTVRNPGQNYIANWNNRPSAEWVSSDLWTYTWSRADRARLLFDELEANAGASVQDISAINRRIAYADVNAPFVLPYLQAAWQGRRQPARVSAALAALVVWDQQWQAGSDGRYGPQAALMEAWLRLLLEMTIRDDVGTGLFYLFAATNYPHGPLGASLGTPPGVKALVRNLDRLNTDRWTAADYDFFNGVDPAQVLRDSFIIALDTLSKEQGAELAQWRLPAHPMTWQPYNFRGVPQSRPEAAVELPAYMNRGSENNLFIARGDTIEAWDVIPPGQSGFIKPDGRAAQHNSDQMELFARFEYKSVPFTVQDVKALAVSSQSLLLEEPE